MENICYNINVRTQLSFPKSQFPALRVAYPPFCGFNFRSYLFWSTFGPYWAPSGWKLCFIGHIVHGISQSEPGTCGGAWSVYTFGPVKPKQTQKMNLKEILRATTEPLTAPTLRQILEAQQAQDNSAHNVNPLNLWK